MRKMLVRFFVVVVAVVFQGGGFHLSPPKGLKKTLLAISTEDPP